jgi:hypothetical protein
MRLLIARLIDHQPGAWTWQRVRPSSVRNGMPNPRRTARAATATMTLLIGTTVGCHRATQKGPTATRPATAPAMVPEPKTAPVAMVPPPPTTRAVATTSPATVIRSAVPSVDQVLAGRKTSTTRKGTRTYPLGPAVLFDGTRRVAVAITAIDAKHFADLTADDAASDGLASLVDYRATLVRNYPGLADGDVVSVIHFRLVGTAH